MNRKSSFAEILHRLTQRHLRINQGIFSSRHKKSSGKQPGRIEVLLRGGLGNQLFGFAAGFEIASRSGLALHLDTSLLQTQSGPYRDFQLLSLTGQQVSHGPERTVAKTYKETRFSFERRFDQVYGPVFLDGYFQSTQYFRSTSEELRRIIHRTHEYNLGRESAITPFIGLQIRRGDYLQTPHREYHGVIPFKYFLEVSSYLRQQVGDLPVVIFSDDPSEAERLSVQIPDSAPHKAGRNSRPMEILGYLSGARALGISNSSFGWWSAFLAGDSVPVAAPKPWFQDRKIDTSDLLLSRWATFKFEE